MRGDIMGEAIRRRVEEALTGQQDATVTTEVVESLTALRDCAVAKLEAAKRSLKEAEATMTAVCLLVDGVCGGAATRRTSEALLDQLKGKGMSVSPCGQTGAHEEHVWRKTGHGGYLFCPGVPASQPDTYPCEFQDQHHAHEWRTDNDA